MGTEILLAIVAGAEGLLGLLLASHPLSPTLAYPALSICRGLSSGGSGKASVATLEVGFLVFLFVALNDIRALNASVPAGAESTENSLYHSDRLSRALVQALSAFICAVLVPILGSMSLVITKWEKLKVSQAAMLKQVKGLQAEYDRVTSSKAPGAYGKGGSAEGAEEERLRARVNQLRAELDSLKDKLDESDKARKTAEANAAAMKQQAQALEREYDRLMAVKDELEAEHDKLQSATGGLKKDK